jgi:hypothetical protein
MIVCTVIKPEPVTACTCGQAKQQWGKSSLWGYVEFTGYKPGDNRLNKKG